MWSVSRNDLIWVVDTCETLLFACVSYIRPIYRPVNSPFLILKRYRAFQSVFNPWTCFSVVCPSALLGQGNKQSHSRTTSTCTRTRGASICFVWKVSPGTPVMWPSPTTLPSTGCFSLTASPIANCRTKNTRTLVRVHHLPIAALDWSSVGVNLTVSPIANCGDKTQEQWSEYIIYQWQCLLGILFYIYELQC